LQRPCPAIVIGRREAVYRELTSNILSTCASELYAYGPWIQFPGRKDLKN